jgi:hypothetical protein
VVLLNPNARLQAAPPTPDDLVAVVAGPGSAYVELRAPGLPPVRVCGHPNPSIVKEHAEGIRRFVAAVLRADREAAPRAPA